MPYLTVTTNADISSAATTLFLEEAAQAVATGTGKPEQYVMVKLQSNQPMHFAGSHQPTAFLELKSIGFPANSIPGLCKALCDLAAKHLGIAEDRVFTVFTDVKAAHWGQGGAVFG